MRVPETRFSKTAVFRQLRYVALGNFRVVADYEQENPPLAF
jgi:hypothetical protein